MIKKSIIYYTDNSCDEKILKICQKQLLECVNENEIISVSHKPICFGSNIVMDVPRCSISIFKQIYEGLKKANGDIIFLVEHDVLYHPNHFENIEIERALFYYNQNRYQVDWNTGTALFRRTLCTSHLIADREKLINYFNSFFAIVNDIGYSKSKMGFAPATHKFIKGFSIKKFMSECPNIDIRHNNNWTKTRWRKEEYKDKNAIQDWRFVEEIPYWGKPMEVFKNLLEN